MEEEQNITSSLNKLYGRDDELQAINKSFESVSDRNEKVLNTNTSNNYVRVIFVSGSSGTGKSILIQTALEKQACLVGTGKFVKYQKNRRESKPFSVLGNVMKDLSNSIMELDDISKQSYQDSIRDQLGCQDIYILSRLSPRIADLMFTKKTRMTCEKMHANKGDIMDDTKENNNDNNHKEHEYNMQCLNRLKSCFLRFFRAVALAGQTKGGMEKQPRPLVLYIDDLQWACPATLDIFESIFMDSQLRNIIFIGCYRDKEIEENTHAVKWMCCMERKKKKNKTITATDADSDVTNTDRIVTSDDQTFTKIILGNLSLSEIENLLMDLMKIHTNNINVRELAAIIHSRTNGNPFHVIQLLDYLHSEQFITQSILSLQWTWDTTKIREQTSLSDNVLEIVTAKMKRLPNASAKILKIAALLGFRFRQSIIQLISESDKAIQINPIAQQKNEECPINADVVQIDNTENTISSCLECCINQGFFERLDFDTLKFAHDKIYQAALQLTQPEKNQSRIHYQIGIILWNKHFGSCKVTSTGIDIHSLEDHIVFTCANELNMGFKNNPFDNDKHDDFDYMDLVKLNYQIARKASSFSAYFPAMGYLKEAIAIIRSHGSSTNNKNNTDNDIEDDLSLPPSCWENDIEFVVELFCFLAELAYAAGQLIVATNAVKKVLKHANCCTDLRARALMIQLRILISESKFDDVMTKTFQILDYVGEKYVKSKQISKLQQKIIFQRTKRKLQSKMKQIMSSTISPATASGSTSHSNIGIDDTTSSYNNNDGNLAVLSSLQHMTDKCKLLVVQLYSILFFAAFQTGNHKLVTVTICRIVQLTLQHGIAPSSSVGFARMANEIVRNSIKDIDYAFRMSELALTMADKMLNTSANRGDDDINIDNGVQEGDDISSTEANNAKAETLTAVTPIKQLRQPLSIVLDNSLEGYELSMAQGNTPTAFVNITSYFILYFYSGLSLQPLLDDLKRFLQQFIDYNQNNYVRVNTPIYQCVLNLTGNSDNPLSMHEGIAIDLRLEAVGDTVDQSTTKETEMSYLMQSAFYLGRMDLAIELSEKLRGIKDIGFYGNMPFVHARVFFFALIAIWQYKNTRSPASAALKPKYKRDAMKYITLFRGWVKERMINCVHKLQILEAELLSMNKRNYATDQLGQAYDKAISASTRIGFLQDSALSNYLAGVHYQEKENDSVTAKFYIQRAHSMYKSWGAEAVVQHLESKAFPDILKKDDNIHTASKTSFRSHKSSTTVSSSSASSMGYRSRQRFNESIESQHKKLPSHLQAGSMKAITVTTNK